MHLLRSPAIAAALVRSADVGSGDLVLDLGAGTGAITRPLAATGARVLAIERDADFVARLSAELSRRNVRVVRADLRTVPLPRREYTVVASIPYSISTPL
ncbi:MAG: methyltransferase domain-containing protein, partial [Actinophytocola sp.]|nr:methyltransferase domain-containing protein [Actinophytocola sp.]